METLSSPPRLRLHDRPNLPEYSRQLQRFGILCDLTGWPARALVVLVLIDCISIMVDVVVTAAGEAWPGALENALLPLRLDTEYGLWATTGYLKLGFLTGVLFEIFWLRRDSAYLILTGIFAFMMLDDSLKLHERFGRLYGNFHVLPSFRGVDPTALGELVYFVILGIVIAVLLLLAVIRAKKAEKPTVLAISGFVLLIGFFAAGLDFLDVLVSNFSRVAMKVVSLTEDGGENIVVSLAIVFALGVIKARRVAERRSGREVPAFRLE